MSHAKSSQDTPQSVLDRERQEPKQMPRTLDEFNNMTLQERQWMFDNKHSLYEKFQRMNRKEWD